MNRILTFLTVWLVTLTSGLAADPLPAPSQDLPLVTQDSYLSGFTAAQQTVYKTTKGEPYRVFHLEFESPEAAAKFQNGKDLVYNRSGRFVDTFAPPTAEALKALSKSPGLVWLDYDRTVRLPPPPPEAKPSAATRAAAEEVVQGGIGGYKGKGVVLAIVDSGFDVRHPDFQTVGPDGKVHSRFKMLWDTTETRTELGQPAPIRYPDGRSIGVVYTQQDLGAYLATPVAQRPHITWDDAGHGTACAGIAAGNGTENSKYLGAAPEADLIGVRLGDQAENTFLVTAIFKWLDEYAGARPLVISNSWGGHRSGHDGTLLVERQIDERFPADRPGRLVLFAAGNEGENPLHMAKDFGAREQAAVLRLPKVAEGDEVELTLYFDSADQSLNVLPPVKSAFQHAITKQWVARFTPKPGQETLTIFSKDGKKGHVDAYIAGKIGKKDASFDTAQASYEELVNNPGNAENVLTVGSYDFNPFFETKGKRFMLGVGEKFDPMTVGDISAYSSPGYTRLGRLKPDLAAPGQWWTAAAPLQAKKKLLRDSSGKYQLFNGTSAATPYTAGVMAVFLQKNPNLTLNQVRDLLEKTLKEDLYTGPLPNPHFGRGKLDKGAVLSMFERIPAAGR